MFEHFTFGAQAQTSYQKSEDVIASPTDCSNALLLPPKSYFSSTESSVPLCEIMDAFSQQTIYPDEASHCSIWNKSIPSPDFTSDLSTDDEFTPEEMCSIPSTTGMNPSPSISSKSSLPNLPHLRTSTNLNTVGCRRLQRQLNTQLQSCHSHQKDISTLVEDMLTTSTQCRLYKVASGRSLTSTPPPPPLSGLVPSSKEELEAESAVEVQTLLSVDPEDGAISPDEDEDEGFAEMDDPYGMLAFEEEMSLRRASEPTGIRKYNVVRLRKTVDCVRSGNGLLQPAKTKVRSVPRTRRRKVEIVVE